MAQHQTQPCLDETCDACCSMLAYSASAGVAGTLVWEAWVQLGWSSVSYDFMYTDVSVLLRFSSPFHA